MNKKNILKSLKYGLRFLPDRVYVQLYFFSRFKRLANLRNPQTFNEKLNWLKLYFRDPLYPRLVDKYEAKEYVRGLLGGG